MSTPDHILNEQGAKYLTVVLDREAYGIAVLKVREIIRMQKITSVPQMPAHVMGVINLRGRVVPVVDLRKRLDLTAELTERTCIVVVWISTASEQTIQMGLIVDSVDEVVNLADSAIEPPPEFGSRITTDYIRGMAKVKNQIITLLDIDRVIAPPPAIGQAELAGVVSR